MEKTAPIPFRDSPPLQAFQRYIEGGVPDLETFQSLLGVLEEARQLEHALLLFKQARLGPGPWEAPLAILKAAVARSRARRMSLWQVDPHRRTLRLRFEVRKSASGLRPPELVATLARLLMEAGLPVAMGLEKTPRPAVHLGHPLPLGVEGWGEWADVGLQEEPDGPLEGLMELVNFHAPEGLRLLQGVFVPNFASPVSDLCRQAHWRWECPEDLLDSARERMAAFLAADRFELEKPGKVDGQKGAKRLDIRPLLAGLQWDGPHLTFQTCIGAGAAPNPRKLLAGILGGAPEAILALVRTDVELREDPRLLQAEKYAPKLHNMFEDAVLLHAGSNIRIVDEDDEGSVILHNPRAGD
jgi:radical SAM-linked protein